MPRPRERALGQRRHAAAIVGALGAVAALGFPGAVSAAVGYEQVTPVDKGGTEPGVIESTRVSSDGNVMHFGANYSISSAQPVSGPYAPSYVARRGDDNWSIAPLDPPTLPSNPGSGLLSLVAGISRDGSRAIVVSQQVLAPGAIEGGLNIYRRDLRSGATVLIGSDESAFAFGAITDLAGVSLPSTIVGSTDDFSRVWMKFSGGIRLTSDAIAGGSLYEWSEDDGLQLASLKPDGSPFVSSDGGLADGYQAPRNPNIVSQDGRQQILVETQYDPVTWMPVPDPGLYVRRDGVTKPVSYSRATGASDDMIPLWASNSLAASADGRFIAFVVYSSEKLTDDAAGGSGLYVYDREQPEADQLTYVAGPDSLPGDPFGHPEVLQMSDDGSALYFAFADSVYLWKDGAVRQVAASGGWGPNGNPTLALAQTANLNGSAYQASPSGRYFAFSSVASLTGADMRNPECIYEGWDPSLDGYCAEQFVYDAEADSISCASCPTDGSPSRGPVAATSINRAMWGNELRARPIVFDSGKVLFDTPNALVEGDTNAARDVYSYEAGERTMISRGTPNTTARLMTATVDGTAVYFITDDPIVAQDTDRLRDIYLARDGAGLPAQQVGPDPGDRCTGSDCRPASPPGPGAEPPASQGGGGPAPLPPSKKAMTLRASLAARAVKGTRVRVVVNVANVGSGATLRVSGRGVVATTRQVRKNGRVVVSVRLSKQSRRTLSQRGRVSLNLRVSGSPTFGSSKAVRVKKSVRSGR